MLLCRLGCGEDELPSHLAEVGVAWIFNLDNLCLATMDTLDGAHFHPLWVGNVGHFLDDGVDGLVSPPILLGGEGGLLVFGAVVGPRGWGEALALAGGWGDGVSLKSLSRTYLFLN